MDQLCAFEAILFPCDGRQPHLVALMTSPMSYQTYYGAYSPQTSRLPHPEHYMSFVAEGLGPRAWKYHVRDSSYLRLTLRLTSHTANRSSRRHEQEIRQSLHRILPNCVKGR